MVPGRRGTRRARESGSGWSVRRGSRRTKSGERGSDGTEASLIMFYCSRKQQEKNEEPPKNNIDVVDKQKRNERIRKLLICSKSRLLSLGSFSEC